MDTETETEGAALTTPPAPRRIIIEHRFEWDKISLGVAWTFLVLCFAARLWTFAMELEDG